MLLTPRWAKAAANPAASVFALRLLPSAVAGGRHSTNSLAPAGASSYSITVNARPVSLAACSPGLPIVADAHTTLGLAP